MRRQKTRNIRPENPKAPSVSEVEELFRSVDETGHANPAEADAERARRDAGKDAVEVDPLDPTSDPSGSNVERMINRTAVIVVSALIAVVLLSQLSCSVGRRATASSLADKVSVSSVTSALRLGVSWGDGYTQFPEEFVVKEADENTGRIEVSVNNKESGDALSCFSNSQIQAAALSVNALLNPKINTVIYHVNVCVDSSGNIEQSQFFGLLQPTGELRSFMTFVWTKQTTDAGVTFSCTITEVDADTAGELRDALGATTLVDTDGDGVPDTPEASTDATTSVSSESSDASDASAAEASPAAVATEAAA